MHKLKTYIVEDSAVIRHNLIAALEELAPVEVVGTAEAEDTAVAWLDDRAYECDLLIIDIFLKRGSGLGVLKAAHAMRRPLTLVVLTNFATPDMRQKRIGMGATRVFDKSQEIDDLVKFCSGHPHPDERDGA